MAGHSKWANIKHRKARQDAAKGKTWSKCSRAIIVAARQGDDPDFNLTLRYAIDEAKAANLPKDTIAKAITRGTGVSGGAAFEEVRYEGYGPAGVAAPSADSRRRRLAQYSRRFATSRSKPRATGR